MDQRAAGQHRGQVRSWNWHRHQDATGWHPSTGIRISWQQHMGGELPRRDCREAADQLASCAGQSAYDGSIATRKRPADRAGGLTTLKASDAKLARLIDATEPVDTKAWRRARPLGEPFGVLVYSIIGQQISGFAARAIAGRLTARFGGRMPSPAELLALDPADLKSVGLSR